MSIFDTKIDGDSIIEENYTVVYEDHIIKGLLLKSRGEITIPQRIKNDLTIFYCDWGWLFRRILKNCLEYEVNSFCWTYPVLKGKIDDLKFITKEDIDKVRDIFNDNMSSYKFIIYKERKFYEFPLTETYVDNINCSREGVIGEIHKYIYNLIKEKFKEDIKEYIGIC